MKFQSKLALIDKKLFINGQYVSSSGKKFPVISPSTETIITEGVNGTNDDVDKAVLAAKQAFESASWRGLDPHVRGRLLYKLADLIE